MLASGKVAFGFVLKCGCALLVCFAVWSASGQAPAPRSAEGTVMRQNGFSGLLSERWRATRGGIWLT